MAANHNFLFTGSLNIIKVWQLDADKGEFIWSSFWLVSDKVWCVFQRFVFAILFMWNSDEMAMAHWEYVSHFTQSNLSMIKILSFFLVSFLDEQNKSDLFYMRIIFKWGTLMLDPRYTVVNFSIQQISIQGQIQFIISGVYQMFQIMSDLYVFMNLIYTLEVTNSFQFGILTR